jgi:hypothetical protein
MNWLNPSYHPQVNPAEGVNKVIVPALKSYVGADQAIWEQELPKTANAICTSVHGSSGLTPRFTPFFMVVKCHFREKSTKLCVDFCRLNGLNDTVKTNLQEVYKTYSRRYNLRTRPQVNYDVGSAVWRKNRQQSKKTDKITSKLTPQYPESNSVSGERAQHVRNKWSTW